MSTDNSSTVQFIPAVLCQTAAESVELIRQLSAYSPSVHLDIADGSLVPNRTALPGELGELNDINPRPVIDAHLMVDNPLAYFHDLNRIGVSRAVVHAEAKVDPSAVIEQAARYSLRLAVALNPSTGVARIQPYANSADFIQLMAIEPGFGGQPFIESTYQRLAEIRQAYPDLPIAVDGGVRLANAKRLIEAGATILIAGRGGFMPDGDMASGFDQWRQLLKAKS